MKCFMHQQEEAIAVCKSCGKAMCINCSSYCDHSGTCPACKKVELEREYFNIKESISNRKFFGIAAIVAVILVIVMTKQPIAFLLFSVPFCFFMTIPELKEKAKKLDDEITKLDAALEKGNKTL